MYLLLFLLSVVGLFPAYIARQKGHSFALWWLYGAVLFVVALPHALVLRKAGESASPWDKACPYCHEPVPQEDDICPSCHLHLYDPVLDGSSTGGGMTHRHA